MSERNPSGAVHPTVLLLFWALIGFGLEYLQPTELPGASFRETLTPGLGLVGVMLFGWSIFELWRHGTTMEHKEHTTALVTRGPYGLSRNPIYVALTLILLALSLEAASLWLLLLTSGFWAGVQRLTVAREEAYLQREFGEEYLEYRSSVRRWI